MIVATARDAADLLEPLFADAEGEKLAVLHLDPDRRMIALEEHATGELDALTLPIRAIFASALSLGTHALVIAHNHPSGNPEPSAADIDATRRLAETAANLGIRLDDHLIFAGGDCRSFRQLGLL